MVLKIVQAGEPVLRRRARELTLEEVTGPAVQQLIALMRDTLRDAPGVGLSAPQRWGGPRCARLSAFPRFKAELR